MRAGFQKIGQELAGDGGGDAICPVWTFLGGSGYIFREPLEVIAVIGCTGCSGQVVFRVRLSGGFTRWLQFKNA
jgi:hypothetical protein